MLDNRLKMCLDMVGGSGIVCDVGTDHAHLAAELILSGKCKRVIASDINEGPLESAKRTVEKHGIADRVELVLSDGLKNITLDEVSDVIIAGMGGETIAEIIANTDANDLDHIRFILQPMTKPEILRKKIYDYQMKISSEKIVEDGDKLYVVMCAEYNEDFRYLTETEAVAGFFDDDDPLARKYREREINRLKMISESLEKGGKHAEAVHYAALACKLEYGTESVGTEIIFDCLNELYPVSTQEKWDNSGFLVENSSMECSKVVLSLDITDRVISEADCKGAGLIISHHPVIFEPLKKIESFSPVFRLIDRGIAAICMHTNLDIAIGGTNGVILGKLMERFELACEPEPFEDCGGGRTLGWVITLKNKVLSTKFALILKEIFGCEYIRTTRDCMGMISKIAFCSGSGGSMLDLAIERGCNAYITGDVKHDVWIDANNRGIMLFDCGHFHTENLVLWELRRVLEEKFPCLDVEIAERSVDPVEYI